MLLDSNIIIYGSQPEHSFLRALLNADDSVVSGVSYPEVLGYPDLSEADKADFEAFFETTPILPVDWAVLKRSADLRQTRRMKLGDALIAATALGNGLTLATRNVTDFSWIPGLTLFNPFDRPAAS